MKATSVVVSDESGGSNQGVWKSKSAATRMKRRSEQYTHGRLRKYVAEMKRTRYTGEAFVLSLPMSTTKTSEKCRKLTGKRV